MSSFRKALVFCFVLICFVVLTPKKTVYADVCAPNTCTGTSVHDFLDGCLGHDSNNDGKNDYWTQKYVRHTGFCNATTCQAAGIQALVCNTSDGTTSVVTEPPISCCSGGGGGGGGGNCNHSYSCAASGNSVSMSKCCSGSNCCGTINSGPNKGKNKICRDNGCAPQPPVCTAPVINSVARVSSTSLQINWIPGTGTTAQKVYVGANKTEVTNNCPGTGSPTCVVKTVGLPAAQNNLTTGNVLALGTVYYIKVVNAGSCNVSSSIPNHLSSCLVSPTSLNMNTNSTATITTSIQSSADISQVTYTSSSPSIASISPASDTTYIYKTTATSGSSAGSSTITSKVYLGATLACTGSASINVVPAGPWWQVKDSDLSTNADILSEAPNGKTFGLDGTGGYPGVVSYGTSFDFSADSSGTGTVSSTGWLANSLSSSTKTYDAAYFMNQIPSDAVITSLPSNTVDGSYFESGGTLSYGYYWYKYDGSLTGLDVTISSAMNLGDRKVILIVDAADLNIAGNINLDDGHGFFMAIAGQTGGGAKGRIKIDPTVGGGVGPNLEGIYEGDNGFLTGTSYPSLDTTLSVRGSVASVYGSVLLQRDLGGVVNNTTPAEFFEFAPDQIMLFPSKLGARKINWKEVAP